MQNLRDPPHSIRPKTWIHDGKRGAIGFFGEDAHTDARIAAVPQSTAASGRGTGAAPVLSPELCTSPIQPIGEASGQFKIPAMWHSPRRARGESLLSAELGVSSMPVAACVAAAFRSCR